MEKALSPPLIAEGEIFVRMTGPARLQHLLNIVTFIVLMATGLPLIVSWTGLHRAFVGSARAFLIRGMLHRAAAVVLIANFLWHVLYTVFSEAGREHFREMVPRAGDLRDAVRTLGHNLGFAAPPALGRFGFVEKFEYWSFLWGSFVMIVSGFFIWDVDLSLRLFPPWVRGIFLIVHSYEAVLALLAILIWHMYTVHLNPRVFPMSRVWINGRTTGREMRERHSLEYERIAARRLQEAGAAAKEAELMGPLKRPEAKG
jgi:cytochrome b subunit of formate dehydrogenase